MKKVVNFSVCIDWTLYTSVSLFVWFLYCQHKHKRWFSCFLWQVVLASLSPVVLVNGRFQVNLDYLVGADFRRAMLATTSGEKLLIGCRPMRNWTRRTISGLFLYRKLHLFLGKSTKTAATRAALFDSNMHQIVPQTHWGSLQLSPDPLAVFRGPTSKRRGMEFVPLP